MPITLLEDQRPRHIAEFWREPMSGTDADNPSRAGPLLLSAIRVRIPRQQLGGQDSLVGPAPTTKT
jgi:hypothetical protein